MDSRVKVFGHSAHQMLIVFPLGLLGTSVVFDLLGLFNDSAEFARVGFWMIAAGIIGGLIAAPFGTIDWLAIPANTRAKRIGLMHAGANVVALIIFAVNWFYRYSDPDSVSGLTLALSFAGLFAALPGAWLGGELVSRLSVGVDDGAHLNAPNSLSGKPASSQATGR